MVIELVKFWIYLDGHGDKWNVGVRWFGVRMNVGTSVVHWTVLAAIVALSKLLGHCVVCCYWRRRLAGLGRGAVVGRGDICRSWRGRSRIVLLWLVILLVQYRKLSVERKVLFYHCLCVDRANNLDFAEYLLFSLFRQRLSFYSARTLDSIQERFRRLKVVRAHNGIALLRQFYIVCSANTGLVRIWAWYLSGQWLYGTLNSVAPQRAPWP